MINSNQCVILLIITTLGRCDYYITAKNLYYTVANNPSPPVITNTNALGYINNDGGVLLWPMYSGGDGLERQTWLVGPRNAQIKSGGSPYNPADHIPDGNAFLVWNKTEGWIAIGLEAKLDCVNITKTDNSNRWYRAVSGNFTNVCNYRLAFSMEASWVRALPLYYSKLDGTLLGGFPGIPSNGLQQDFIINNDFIATVPLASAMMLQSASFAVDKQNNMTFHMELFNYNKIIQKDGLPGQLFAGVSAKANACPNLDPSIPNRAMYTTKGIIFLPDNAYMNGDDLITQATNASGISFIATLDPKNMYIQQLFTWSNIAGPSAVASDNSGPAFFFSGKHFPDDFIWMIYSNGGLTNQPLNLPFVSQIIPMGSPGNFIAPEAVNPTPILCPWGQRLNFTYIDTGNPFDPYSGVSCSCVVF